jgi:hypothetical protein
VKSDEVMSDDLFLFDMEGKDLWINRLINLSSVCIDGLKKGHHSSLITFLNPHINPLIIYGG